MVENRTPQAPCPQHDGMPATGKCVRCGQPICRECVAARGYFCSDTCREQTRQSISPAEKQQRVQAEAEERTLIQQARRILLAAAAILVMLAFFLVWRHVLAAPGRIAWQWATAEPQSDLNITAAADGRLFVVAGDSLAVLSARNGKLLRQSDLPWEMPAWDTTAMTVDGSIVLHDSEHLLIIGRDGRVTFSYVFDRPVCHLAIAPDLSRAWFVLPPAFDYAQQKNILPCSIGGLDLKTGDRLWQQQPEGDLRVTELLATASHLLVLTSNSFPSSYSDEETESVTILQALSLTTGKPAWQMKLPQFPEYGPVLADGIILLQVEQRLHGVAVDGRKLWSIDLDPVNPPACVAAEGLLFLATPGGTECRDVQTGTVLWSADTQLDGQFLRVTDQRILASGLAAPDAATAGTGPLPPAYDELDSVIKEMSGNEGGLAMLLRKPVCVCLDRASGKTVWTAENVLGELFFDGDRLVECLDSSQGGPLAGLTGGKGFTIVQQYNVKNGARLYRRQLDIGLLPFGLAAGRLVGVTYDQVDRPGLMELIHNRKATDIGFLQPPHMTGAAGIRLK